MSVKIGSRTPGQKKATTTRSQPEFYAVAAGSYDSNANYGSGAPALFGSFQNVTIDEDCAHVIRRNKNVLDFNTKITLDTAEGLPEDYPSADGEVRIRTRFNGILLPLHTLPQGDVLSPNYPQTQSSLFDVDVNIEQNIQTHFPIITGGRGQVQARLLNSGDLALVTTVYDVRNDNNPIPITVADILLMFGEGSGNTVFNIRGNYLI